MGIHKRLALFCIALLTLPVGVILLLLRILYYRTGALDSLEEYAAAPRSSFMRILVENYPLILIGLALVGFIAIIITGILFMRGLLRPINQLTKAAREIERGNLDYAITYDRKDEFLQVFLQFDRMRTKLKDSLWQQIKEEESRAEMIANIAHDLRTPITSIQGYAQGLLDGVAKTDEKREKYLETIIVKSHELNRMSESLSAFSKAGSRHVNIEKKRISAKEFIGGEMAEISMNLTSADVSFKIEVSDLTRIDIDEMQIRRVFSNIVQNSLKYKGDGIATLDISAYENDNYVIVCFADQGLGVKEGELKTIFNRFYRSDYARQNTSNGSGLGLAISKQIMLSHKGYIWARQNKPRGIQIFVSFPKVQENLDENIDN